MADSLILMVLALVVFGPRRLPQIGRQLGRLMYEFRKASNDFKFQMEEELRIAEDADRRKQDEARQKTLAADAPAEPASIPVESSAAEASAADSPDAGEGTPPADSASVPAEDSSAPSPAPGLRVHPPSIGEVVAAERPGAASNAEPTSPEPDSPELNGPAQGILPLEAALIPTAGQDASPGESSAESTPAEKHDPATEAASHNG
ncbi:MAG TPA: twin-arginine translocase TatA/TatE family subunit [Terracidiphilus sp.]|nr:twin-arginine translocase TatA/TatE family subunit [Terracidiphilus sp.]